tara:strand:+ start:65 stop:985 length:921 start_codon:yes stop_codon:yes gene_type:complete
MIPNNLFNIMKEICICPYCNGDLKWQESAFCIKCGDEYPIDGKTNQIDLRLKRAKEITVSQIVGQNVNVFHNESGEDVYSFSFGYSRKINGIQFPFISKGKRKPVSKLYSWLPKGGGIALDIGSAKDKNNRLYIESAGFDYISVDYDSPEAMILADAHSLPFKNSSIKCLINLAVMEHVEHPFIAGKEFFRILKNDGRMLGVVAFLQQQHMSSWYHFTHYGVYSWLKNSGFDINKFKIDASDKRYHGIFNTASLIGLPKWLKNLLLNPIYFLHRVLWWIYQKKSKKNLEQQRHLQTAGAIHFIADK